MIYFNMIAANLLSTSGDPFDILKDNEIRTDLFSSINVSGTLGIITHLGIGACICALLWYGIMIALGSGKMRNEAKDGAIHKMVILALLGGSLGILEIFRQIASNLAGLG